MTISGPKFNLFISDVKDHEDSGRFRSYDLESTGNSLEELLENAVYWQTDQDGGSMGDVRADDDLADTLITNWYAKRGGAQ